MRKRGRILEFLRSFIILAICKIRQAFYHYWCNLLLSICFQRATLRENTFNSNWCHPLKIKVILYCFIQIILLRHYQGIQARPLNEDNMFTWEGTIKGPKDTMWEGEWCVTVLGLLSIPQSSVGRNISMIERVM